jgi:hypothetical protein
MDNKHIFIAIIAALVLTGCGEPQQQNSITDPFIGGNVAVNLYLQNGAPPPTIYDGGKFPFGVNIVVENVGEADFGPGTDNPYVAARLEGILPNNYGVTDADLNLLLQERINGAHKNFDGTILGGQVTNFVFPQLNYQKRLVGNNLATIRGTICYDYSNLAVAQICMKDDLLENVQDSTICSLTGDKPVHNSGGPIHVTNVIQNPLSANKIQVTFVIEHVGGMLGEFYGRSVDEDCNPSVKNTNKYRIDVQVDAQDSGSIVQCYRLGNTNSGSLTMYSGSPQPIVCTVERSPDTTARIYTDTLTIKTKYRYGQFIEQPIVIQAVPQD